MSKAKIKPRGLLKEGEIQKADKLLEEQWVPLLGVLSGLCGDTRPKI